MTSFSPSDLEAYLDEALPPEEMARIEKALRGDAALVQELASIQARRSSGVHSLGDIWRRHRLSCPSREQLASHLLDAAPEKLAAYITFHIEVAGCRYCQANLADLRTQRAQPDQATQMRRRKYFQSSAGASEENGRRRADDGREERLNRRIAPSALFLYAHASRHQRRQTSQANVQLDAGRHSPSNDHYLWARIV